MVNIITPNWSEYELIDSGNGRKLERFGKYILNRVETQAFWHQSKPESEWQRADAVFRRTSDRGGEWEFKKDIPHQWVMPFENLKLELRLTPFGHVGIFPDQSSQWTWISEKIRNSNRKVNILNLFTYTGAGTLAASNAGANVVHVDASKPAITWARDNQRLSGLEQKPIRWIPEDAMKFVKREVRRNSRYDAIIMDPPKYGRGAQGEVWKFEEDFPELLDYCRQLMSDNPLFILTTAYAVPISPITLGNLMSDATKKLKGTIESGELALKQSGNERLLPTAIYSRWEQ
ncbi:MAG TPA: class I SAM-dependent methyltransferase [Patescibacteria group bacterium]|nr:class I SAM-dependent methyltransferase [Patescibacteria group bacterium]